jgi:hypothetical protein
VRYATFHPGLCARCIERVAAAAVLFLADGLVVGDLTFLNPPSAFGDEVSTIATGDQRALSLMFNLAPPAERALSRLDGVSAGHGTATA